MGRSWGPVFIRICYMPVSSEFAINNGNLRRDMMPKQYYHQIFMVLLK